jgi:hypothetical protein
MRSNAGMANRHGDVNLRFAQVYALHLTLWLGLTFKSLHMVNLLTEAEQ